MARYLKSDEPMKPTSGQISEGSRGNAKDPLITPERRCKSRFGIGKQRVVAVRIRQSKVRTVSRVQLNSIHPDQDKGKGLGPMVCIHEKQTTISGPITGTNPRLLQPSFLRRYPNMPRPNTANVEIPVTGSGTG